MSINQNESKEGGQEDQPAGFPISPDDRESWFADLLDIRVLIFLFSVVVIAMTATVLVLSTDPDDSDFTNPGGVNSATKTPASSGANSATNQPEKFDSPETTDKDKDVNRDKNAFTKPQVEQASDGSFELPIRSAMVTGCEASLIGIADWQSGGSAQWQLAVQDRRTGYFRCFVTYVARFESQFAVQLGDRNSLKFTIYPHETDFTEEFIIRLDTPEESSLRLIANKLEQVSGVTVKRVRLVPR